MNDSTKLLQLIDQLDKVKILCLGDVMLDKFVYGDVSRISPEAPVPVCRVIDEVSMLGGAGNVARNLAEVGVSVDFVSVVGNDEAADQVQSLVQGINQIRMKLIREPGRQTTIKERYFGGSQQLMRLDREDCKEISNDTKENIFDYVRTTIATADALILSDYGKGVLTPDSLQELISIAKTYNCPVIVDPKGDDYRRYRGATVITPNLRELSESSQRGVIDNNNLVEAARFIAMEYGIENILVTRSAEGMTLISDKSIDHLPAEAREIFDVSGAGDTVVAILAAVLAAGGSLLMASRLSNIAAGIAVGKTGTAVVSATELVESLQSQDTLNLSKLKILSLEDAKKKVEVWRSQSDKIGFTNGCFDLIHPGHLALLAESRLVCDRLIVGLNSDASVKQIKGESRPIQNEESRASVLASLASVDLVVVFSEETPIELIKALRPDFLSKGADYLLENVIGADLVQSYGGQVLLVDIEEGHSTTRTIERLER
ncbi:MAG: bifunctional heptose 7-phosphate kinase/heptose 1-phosphate adenyltransferase [Rhodospirillales bacterium]|nr:bifunctional heptose 7-phosphate kinase/heptose 1-phosphate adenyltransferase [Rhodospirillales bacterium]|tara:strand:+ start:4499 stop:5962 length:1464 start_codon:yes stop_codon:yes gene_type:complete